MMISKIKETSVSFKRSIRALGLGSVLTLLLLSLFPIKANAQGTLFDLLDDFMGVIDLLVRIVMGLALVFFLWGVAKFILKADNEAERAKGKQVMIWGLIALFVMASVWGIIGFFQGEIFPFGVPGADVILEL